MNYIDLMWIIGAVLVIYLLLKIYKTFKSKKVDREGDMSFFTTVCIIVLIFCVATNIFAYSHAVSIPYEYQALVKNVDDMEEYLMKYENVLDEGFGSIGQGLESLEYKQELQQAIKDKNEKHAGICAMLENYWTPYKDLIINGLPSGNYGTLTISE